MEAELKIGTVKALKVGMKILSNFGDSPQPLTNPEAPMGRGSFHNNMQGHGEAFPPPMMGGNNGPSFERRGNEMNFPSGSGPEMNRLNPYMNNENPMPFIPNQMQSSMRW